MTEVVPLVDARRRLALRLRRPSGWGTAARAGLPIPPGVALSGAIVDAVAAGDEDGDRAGRRRRCAPLRGPLAVRSSAVDEDGADASFAGQHLTLLNVPSADDVSAAVREIWWSANSDSAITYRQRVGLFTRPSVGVVVQSLLDPDSAGVMFTRNPINGADERVIEASWGLGEAVVAGPRDPGQLPDRPAPARCSSARPGSRSIAIRAAAGRRHRRGGRSRPSCVEQLCLDDDQLAELDRLAGSCEEVYGPARDIEWAFAGGQLYLLQCRAVTRAGSDAAAGAAGSDPAEVDPARPALRRPDEPTSSRSPPVQGAPLRRRARPSTKEGAGGAAFYVIESGEATRHGRRRAARDADGRATTSARSP